jgi:hypothetical protein
MNRFEDIYDVGVLAFIDIKTSTTANSPTGAAATAAAAASISPATIVSGDKSIEVSLKTLQRIKLTSFTYSSASEYPLKAKFTRLYDQPITEEQETELSQRANQLLALLTEFRQVCLVCVRFFFFHSPIILSI